MKKVGIITTSSAGNGSFANNYGAALQGYALKRQVELLGYEAYDVNYVSIHEHHPQQYGWIKKTAKRVKLVFNIERVKNKIKSYQNRGNQNILTNAFMQFIRENNLTYNKGKFYTYHQLKEHAYEFDAFITGSDVVWNPYLHQNVNDEGYFLNFVPDGIKRIAYAPSIGVTTLPEESKKNLQELLEKFDSLSIREKSGAKLIKKETGLDVPVVLDPTLLLEPKEYEKIVRIPNDLPDRYMAVYKFGSVQYTDKAIKILSQKLNLPIVFIPSNNDGIYEPRYDLGPGEFIGVIRNAEFVITDSFHCTIFCLINHTRFLTFCRTIPKAGKDINSRMIDLLRMVGLEDEMIFPEQDINKIEIKNIDFEEADKKIEQLRRKSLKYLENALEG